MAVYGTPRTLLMCVYRRDKALCHRGLKDTPSLDQSVPTCVNIARTDQHATGLRLRATTLTQQAGHVPGPLGERLRDHATRLRTDVEHLVRAVNQLTAHNRQLLHALSQPNLPVRALPTQPHPDRTE
ncbi:MAG: hypothetical protein JF597_06010 [Streptomyces sp.]|uniref:hypothetical protein n=1 Tax=Streptomyces sp. TaxID=1931 RepID=UPI0025CFF21A|nr:hypothetical protein [Streptomyces sp.]MBW8793145.1 hypothetical protein [Streptomyces sp.]